MTQHILYKTSSLADNTFGSASHLISAIIANQYIPHSVVIDHTKTTVLAKGKINPYVGGVVFVYYGVPFTCPFALMKEIEKRGNLKMV